MTSDMTEIKCIKPRQHLKGLKDGKEVYVYRCSYCGMTLALDADYCQGCGCFVDWEEVLE